MSVKCTRIVLALFGIGANVACSSARKPETAAAEDASAANPLDAEVFAAGPRDGGRVAGLSAAFEPGTRLASTSMDTRVFEAPDFKSEKIGWLRAGGTVECDKKAIVAPGCHGGFRAIKPRGYVCVGATATVDMNDPIVRASSRRPDTSAGLPYMYGTVKRGGPVYAGLPSEADLSKFEPNLASHLRRWARDKVNGAEYGVELWGKWASSPPPPAKLALDEKRNDENIPWYLENHGRVPNLSGDADKRSLKIGEVSQHNGLSFIESFLREGRRYNVTTDLRVVPADRFRPIKGSTFHGWEFGKDVTLPLAIVRKKGAFSRKAADARKGSGHALEWRTPVKLTGKQQTVGVNMMYELADGTWADDQALSNVFVPRGMPSFVKDDTTWIDIDIDKQILIAYVGRKPVYVTLISTGEAGKGDPKLTRSTPMGYFKVNTKFITATMDSQVLGEEFELRDVPYVQYFEAGYALHAAYWHDVFGMPKSHGCVNMAPEDARWIFAFSEPHVPDGWHGISSKKGTFVNIHK